MQFPPLPGDLTKLLINANEQPGHMGWQLHLCQGFGSNQHHRTCIHKGGALLGVKADQMLIFKVANTHD